MRSFNGRPPACYSLPLHQAAMENPWFQYRMVPHGTVGVYLSLTLTFGIENSSHPFLTLISDHIPKKIVYHVNHVNYGMNSGARLTITVESVSLGEKPLHEPWICSLRRPWPVATQFMLIIPTFVPVKISQDTYLRVLAVLAPCEPHRGINVLDVENPWFPSEIIYNWWAFHIVLLNFWRFNYHETICEDVCCS